MLVRFQMSHLWLALESTSKVLNLTCNRTSALPNKGSPCGSSSLTLIIVRCLQRIETIDHSVIDSLTSHTSVENYVVFSDISIEGVHDVLIGKKIQKRVTLTFRVMFEGGVVCGVRSGTEAPMSLTWGLSVLRSWHKRHKKWGHSKSLEMLYKQSSVSPYSLVFPLFLEGRNSFPKLHDIVLGVTDSFMLIS